MFIVLMPIDVIGCRPCLPLCRPGQRQTSRPMGQRMMTFDRITDRIDIRIARLIIVVDPDAFRLSDPQACLLCQLRTWCHPDGHHDDICFQDLLCIPFLDANLSRFDCL